MTWRIWLCVIAWIFLTCIVWAVMFLDGPVLPMYFKLIGLVAMMFAPLIAGIVYGDVLREKVEAKRNGS